MASHLSVSSISSGVASARSLNGSARAVANDAFAALLGPAGGSPETSMARETDISSGFKDEPRRERPEPESVAAVVDAAVPFQQPVETPPALADIVNDLADLKARLAAGETLDAEALKALEASLTELGDALGIDLSKSIGDLSALLAETPPGEDFVASLTAALAPLAQSIDVAAASTDEIDFSTLLKSISDKLASLLAAMNNGEIGEDQLAQLQMQAETDASLDAALAKLASATSGLPAAEPVLAKPELKITEPVLTGNAELAAAEGETTLTEDAVEQTGLAAKSDDKPARADDGAKIAPIAAAIDEAGADPQALMQQPSAARADIVPAARVVQAGYQTSQQQLNLPQIAFELARQVTDGNTKFQMRLDPPELGRIDVKLEIDASGKVNARLTVEKAETLDLMQRDQRSLERALQQAGLDGSKTNLEFSLKQNPFGGGQQGQDNDFGQSLFGGEPEAEDIPPPTINLYRGSLSASGVNIIA